MEKHALFVNSVLTNSTPRWRNKRRTNADCTLLHQTVNSKKSRRGRLSYDIKADLYYNGGT